MAGAANRFGRKVRTLFEQWGWVPSQPRFPEPLDPHNSVISDYGYEYPAKDLWSTYGQKDWQSEHRGDMDIEDINRSKNFGIDWFLPNPEGGGRVQTKPPVYTEDKMPTLDQPQFPEAQYKRRHQM